jgi:thymidylate synthase ThyX
MNQTLNFYTQWYWKIDLHNLLRFLSLRADPHAQYEIRAYAEVMLERRVAAKMARTDGRASRADRTLNQGSARNRQRA